MVFICAPGVMGTNEEVESRTSENGHVIRNRAAWDTLSRFYFESGRRAWQGDIRWGIWGIQEDEVHILPEVMGQDVIELGCGTAYLSGWLARRGARVVGIDSSLEQLKTGAGLPEGIPDLIPAHPRRRGTGPNPGCVV